MLHSFRIKSAVITVVALIWTAAMLSVAFLQETPVGAVQGIVTAADSGKPIKGADVWITLKESDNYDDIYRSVKTDSEGRYRFKNLPIGQYAIEASAQVHSIPKSDITVSEGKTVSLNLNMKPGPAFLNISTIQNVFTGKETPEITLNGFTKGSKVTFTIYTMDISKLTSGAGKPIFSLLLSGDGDADVASINSSPAIKASKQQAIDVSRRDCEGVYRQNVKLDKLDPGIYVLRASVDGIAKFNWVSKSDLSIVTKTCGGSVLVYAVRPDTGKPVNDAEIDILQNAKIVSRGTTNSSGLWTENFPKTQGDQPQRLIFAHIGNSAAFINTISYVPVSDSVTTYAYTDRPVYRPGQVVHFKGITRSLINNSYKLPAKGRARVEVYDPRNTLVYSADLKLTDFGSFSGSLKLPEYAPTGQYSISTTVMGHEQTVNFYVAEYKKPEFAVTIELPKKRCTRGETIRAKIHANYYFGAPVAGAKIQYNIMRSDYWFWPSDDEDGENEYEDYGGYGESIKDGQAVTGPDGTAEIDFDANWKIPWDSFSVQDQKFTINAYVTDASKQEANAEGSLIATQGNYNITFEPEKYFNKLGETARMRLNVHDYDGHPQRGVDVYITACRLTWEDNIQNIDQVKNKKLTTNSEGYVNFSFDPTKPGDYEIRAVCRDNNGKEIKSSQNLWISGEGDYGEYKYPDLKITFDKRTYNTGDTARLLINSKEIGTTALITVEGRELYQYKTVCLSKNSMIVEIPVKSKYKPNFYVSVCYVKNKKLVSQQASARVSLKAQTLHLTVTSDKNKYEPGETAHYLVKASNADGKPVRAEISLGVVDESIYAVMNDDTQNILKFFYAHQDNSVQTNYSFPEVYLSGDKAGFTGKVRKKFVDTAYWNADLVTDKKGEAHASFKMPDNLTTWRATARACTVNTAVGECRSTVITTKKLLVRLETPRFLVDGDKCTVTAIVHNYLPNRQNVSVALRAEGLSTDKKLTKNVSIDSQSLQTVSWNVSAYKIGHAKLTAYAVTRGAQDAMQLTIPIKPRGVRQVYSKSGIMKKGTVAERLNINPEAVRGASEIRLRLAPSVASTMLGSLDYLAEYPYGCTEQTISTFLPDVVVWKTLRSFGISNLYLQKHLPDMVGKGLNRIYDFQNDSGGWGWCEYTGTDTWMTSYVVYGLLTAKSAGFAVNEDVLDSGLASIRQQLGKKIRSADDVSNKVFALYVLSLSGDSKNAWAKLQPLLKYKFDSKGLALAAIVASNAGHTENAKVLIDVLWKRAITAGDYTYWDVTDQWNDFPSEDAAFAMMAIMKVTPDDTRIPSIVRYLVNQKSYNHWYSTRDTAAAIYALSGYLKKTKELHPNFDVKVLHNGKLVNIEKFTQSTLFSPEREIVIRPAKITSGDNVIRLIMNGSGTLYYTMQLTQFVNPKDIKTESNLGLSISREYRKMTSHLDLSTGAKRSLPSGPIYSNFTVGDIVQVRLIVRNKSCRTYNRLLIEDYIPAGCEAYDRGRVEPWEWDDWYSDKDVRDDRVSFYVDKLPEGTNVLEYEMRASTQGTFIALPSVIEAMYQPSLAAYGSEARIEIRD